MGTRADFYKEDNGKPVWLASIAWDGYPEGIDDAVKIAKTPEAFLAALGAFLKPRTDVTTPDMGWPWPWERSTGSDYAYVFRAEAVSMWCFGRGPYPAWEEHPDIEGQAKDSTYFPDMTDVMNVTMGPRSGLIVIQGGKVLRGPTP